MKPYNELTRLGRLRRIRQLAETAHEAYDVGETHLTFLRYFANITYRVDVPDSVTHGGDLGPYVPNRYLLRVLLSNSWESAEGEMIWLASFPSWCLRRQRPCRRSLESELLTRINTPGVPEGRIFSVMRWVDGRKLSRRNPPACEAYR